VESTVIPPGHPHADTAEQVVNFAGPVHSVHRALMLVGEIMAPYTKEPWFPSWANNSHSGQVIPGLVLFQDGKGGKGGKGSKGKGGKISKGGFGGGCVGGLCLKLLVPPGEASCVLGRGGSVVRDISQNTSTRINTSGRGEFFPGTQLQELRISGGSQEAVLNAISQILEKIAELSGAVSGGDHSAEPGSARLKVVVPFQAASAIIGPGGKTITELRERSGMHVHVEEVTIPPGQPHDLTEQVVSLGGSMDGAKIAMSMIAETVGRYSRESWFEAWAFNSHCGMRMPGVSLKEKGKGTAKGKGLKGDGGMAQDWDGSSDWRFAKGGDIGGDLGSSIRSYGGYNGSYGSSHGSSYSRGRSHSDVGAPIGSMAAAEAEAGPTLRDGSSCPRAHMALKMLISHEEVQVLTKDPTIMQKIQQATGTTGMLSDSVYPGTFLQEVTVAGATRDSVFSAVLVIVRKLSEALGCLSSGEKNVAPGDVRVKLVVPKKAAAAVIGTGGQQVKDIKAMTGIRISVDVNSLPCGDQRLHEQALCLIGPCSSVQPALEVVVREVANLLPEPWFESWASFSLTGQEFPGLMLFEAVSRGKGPMHSRNMY